MNGASQAAAAAIQRYLKPQRANSMKYTYDPKPLYSAGPKRAVKKTPRYMEPVLHEDDVVVTTKTTKVVDHLGRTRSITTETIRTMPDGLNVIETTTRNISRPTLQVSSRGNLRSNLRSNSRSNSLAGTYNLDKIDELHDFEYTYLDGLLGEPLKIKDDRTLSITSEGRRLKLILKSSVDNFEAYPRQQLITSGTNSIKFRETVDTIPYKEKQPENMYGQAMRVAMEKVYGPPQMQTQMQTPPQLPEMASAVRDDGVGANYVYENHHREFQKHLLRGDEPVTHSSHKERVREERRAQKEEKRRQESLLREQERERREQEKERRREEKRDKKGFFSFIRRKEDEPGMPVGVSEANATAPAGRDAGHFAGAGLERGNVGAGLERGNVGAEHERGNAGERSTVGLAEGAAVGAATGAAVGGAAVGAVGAVIGAGVGAFNEPVRGQSYASYATAVEPKDFESEAHRETYTNDAYGNETYANEDYGVETINQPDHEEIYGHHEEIRADPGSVHAHHDEVREESWPEQSNDVEPNLEIDDGEFVEFVDVEEEERDRKHPYLDSPVLVAPVPVPELSSIRLETAEDQAVPVPSHHVREQAVAKSPADAQADADLNNLTGFSLVKKDIGEVYSGNETQENLTERFSTPLATPYPETADPLESYPIPGTQPIHEAPTLVAGSDGHPVLYEEAERTAASSLYDESAAVHQFGIAEETTPHHTAQVATARDADVFENGVAVHEATAVREVEPVREEHYGHDIVEEAGAAGAAHGAHDGATAATAMLAAAGAIGASDGTGRVGDVIQEVAAAGAAAGIAAGIAAHFAGDELPVAKHEVHAAAFTTPAVPQNVAVPSEVQSVDVALVVLVKGVAPAEVQSGYSAQSGYTAQPDNAQEYSTQNDFPTQAYSHEVETQTQPEYYAESSYPTQNEGGVARGASGVSGASGAGGVAAPQAANQASETHRPFALTMREETEPPAPKSVNPSVTQPGAVLAAFSAAVLHNTKSTQAQPTRSTSTKSRKGRVVHQGVPHESHLAPNGLPPEPQTQNEGPEYLTERGIPHTTQLGPNGLPLDASVPGQHKATLDPRKQAQRNQVQQTQRAQPQQTQHAQPQQSPQVSQQAQFAPQQSQTNVQSQQAYQHQARQALQIPHQTLQVSQTQRIPQSQHIPQQSQQVPQQARAPQQPRSQVAHAQQGHQQSQGMQQAPQGQAMTREQQIKAEAQRIYFEQNKSHAPAQNAALQGSSAVASPIQQQGQFHAQQEQYHDEGQHPAGQYDAGHVGQYEEQYQTESQTSPIQAQAQPHAHQSPQFQAQSPQLQTKSPQIQAQSPQLKTQSPQFLGQPSQFQGQSPQFQAQSPAQAQIPESRPANVATSSYSRGPSSPQLGGFSKFHLPEITTAGQVNRPATHTVSEGLAGNGLPDQGTGAYDLTAVERPSGEEPRKKKRSGRFRKMIDKYFVSSTNRASPYDPEPKRPKD